MSWQRTNVQAAAAYLRERIGAGATDARTRLVYEGLLDVLEPTRRATRLQREMAESAKAAATAPRPRERRDLADRRRHTDRRRVNLGPPDGIERRRGERRRGKDRRAGR
jgi:hypothetical protein